jgi:hypothetical protein
MSRAAGTLATIALVLGSLSSPVPAANGTDHAVQVRIGGFFPSGGGDLWDDNSDVFTQDISDFDAASIGFTFLSSLGNAVELGVNLDFYDETTTSVYRGFVEEVEFDDGSFETFDIPHDTRLEIVPLTVDFRFLPGGRYRIRGPQGRRVLKPVFYLGLGGGLNFWDYEEVGDFLDFSFDPPEPFFGRFVDSGTALELHGLAGVELPVGPHFGVLFEARHSWSDDELGDDFAGFGDIDLSGWSAFVGGSFRF